MDESEVLIQDVIDVLAKLVEKCKSQQEEIARMNNEVSHFHEHWNETSNQKDQEIENLKGSIESLNNTVSEKDKQISDDAKKIAELEKKIETQEKAFEDLNNRLIANKVIRKDSRERRIEKNDSELQALMDQARGLL